MKLSFSKDYGTVILAIDDENRDQDLFNCNKLEKLYNSEEWVILLELMAQAEARFDEAVMKVKPQEQSFRETAILAARKNGFCECMKLLGKAVQALKDEKKKTKKIVEDQIDQLLGKEPEVDFITGE